MFFELGTRGTKYSRSTRNLHIIPINLSKFNKMVLWNKSLSVKVFFKGGLGQKFSLRKRLAKKKVS